MLGAFLSDQGLSVLINDFEQANQLDVEAERSRIRQQERHRREQQEQEQDDDMEPFEEIDLPDSPSVRNHPHPRSTVATAPSIPSGPRPRPIIHQHMEGLADHPGLSNAGMYAGLNDDGGAGLQQSTIIIPEETKKVPFDPFYEDFNTFITNDKAKGIDMKYCFFCDRSQGPTERQQDPRYMGLLKIFYESYGKCDLPLLCQKIIDRYEERIRKRKPEKYPPMAVITVRNHFLEHIRSSEIFHVQSVRVLCKIKDMVERNQLFVRNERDHTKEEFDPNAFKTYMTVSRLLSNAFTELRSKRSRASRALV